MTPIIRPQFTFSHDHVIYTDIEYTLKRIQKAVVYTKISELKYFYTMI